MRVEQPIARRLVQHGGSSDRRTESGSGFHAGVVRWARDRARGTAVHERDAFSATGRYEQSGRCHGYDQSRRARDPRIRYGRARSGHDEWERHGYAH